MVMKAITIKGHLGPRPNLGSKTPKSEEPKTKKKAVKGS